MIESVCISTTTIDNHSPEHYNIFHRGSWCQGRRGVPQTNRKSLFLVWVPSFSHSVSFYTLWNHCQAVSTHSFFSSKWTLLDSLLLGKWIHERYASTLEKLPVYYCFCCVKNTRSPSPLNLFFFKRADKDKNTQISRLGLLCCFLQIAFNFSKYSIRVTFVSVYFWIQDWTKIMGLRICRCCINFTRIVLITGYLGIFKVQVLNIVKITWYFWSLIVTTQMSGQCCFLGIIIWFFLL